MRVIRWINDIVFLLVIIVIAVFLGINRSYFLSDPTTVMLPGFITRSFNVMGSFKLYLEMTILIAVMAIVFVQWLLFRIAWAMRDNRRDKAEKENVQLKAKLYELTEGSRLSKLETALDDTRNEMTRMLTSRVLYLSEPKQAEEVQEVT